MSLQESRGRWNRGRQGRAEWTSEGDRNGPRASGSRYGSRRWTSVNKVRRMMVRAEWTCFTSGRVAPQE
ncbi:MAG: DUF1580 domain-containing protein [Clostridia bacterium]|nr:DUF1580 domain-containing protein [Clostridia bacterium]MBQ4351799.1 DUF1580 domain-containing protein [Clostridia bacterium]